MNLEESDLYKERLEKNTRHRRSVMLSIVLCGFLVAFLFILIMVLRYQDSITEKLFLDENQVQLPEGFYKTVSVEKDGQKADVIYIKLRDIATVLGYTYTKGEYNKFNEDEDSCYLQNDFEIVSMSANSEKYKKFVEVNGSPTLAEIEVTMKNENGYNETFTLNYPVKYIENQLYASIDDVSEMLNVQIDWQPYRFRFYSLPYMISFAKASVGKAGITEMSGYYENLKSVLYGYVIVGNGSEEKDGKLYGAVDFSGKEIISIKYDDVKFVQNVKEFYVTVSNGTMGILGADGSTIIAPSEYQDISLLDDEKQLYLVEKDGEFGVVNRLGKKIIHPENDEIGLDVSNFDLEEIENTSLLLEKCIPVKKDNKYGMYNTEGDLILGLAYTGLGYVSTASSKTSGNEASVLFIPPSVGINGIVINQNDLYGIFDVTTETILLPCSFSKIYAITKSGVTTYYMELGGEQLNLADYLKENNLNNVDENGNLLENKSEEDENPTQMDIETSNEIEPLENQESNTSAENLIEESEISNENVVKEENTSASNITVPIL